MPFRATFACLWCGSAHTCRGPDDLEGWAQLCSDCVGKAGDNGFLRFRLRQALEERGAAQRAVTGPGAGAVEAVKVAAGSPPPTPTTAVAAPADDLVAYYEARAAEYDDWYLRRGRYARGAIHDAAWHAELDAAGRWLDGLPLAGRLVELAAGTGWWSPLLASKGELSMRHLHRSTGRATDCWPIGCGPTFMSAMRGRSPMRPPTGCSPGSG
jgi:hypothetical protein